MQSLHAQSGAISVVAIILLSLLCAVTYNTASIGWQIATLQKTTVKSLRHRLRTTNVAIETFATSRESDPATCRSQTGKANQYLHLCEQTLSEKAQRARRLSPILSAQKDYRLLPYLNFNLLLSHNDCTESTPFNPSVKLSSGAAISRTTCLSAKIAVHRTTGIPGNYENDDIFIIDGLLTEDSSHLTISAAGYMHFQSELVVQMPIHLIAGGDVIIQKLSVMTEDLPITLFSATGQVSLGEIVGNPRLSILARSDVIVPAGTQLVAPETLPESIRGIALGMFLIEE